MHPRGKFVLQTNMHGKSWDGLCRGFYRHPVTLPLGFPPPSCVQHSLQCYGYSSSAGRPDSPELCSWLRGFTPVTDKVRILKKHLTSGDAVPAEEAFE